jgi:hypothetical protein
MTAPDQIGSAASKNFLQGRGRPHMVHGYRRGGILRDVGLMFTVAITGGLSCRSSLTPRAAITFLVSGIE